MINPAIATQKVKSTLKINTEDIYGDLFPPSVVHLVKTSPSIESLRYPMVPGSFMQFRQLGHAIAPQIEKCGALFGGSAGQLCHAAHPTETRWNPDHV